MQKSGYSIVIVPAQRLSNSIVNMLKQRSDYSTIIALTQRLSQSIVIVHKGHVIAL